jgi:hypothetical protein
MKRFVMASLGVVLVASSASATAVLRKGFLDGGVPDLPCAIQVDFGGATSGPDLEGWWPIHDYITRSKLIDEAGAWGWGRDGEFSVCLMFYEPIGIEQVFADLKALAPVTPAKNGGWVTVKMGPAQKG